MSETTEDTDERATARAARSHLVTPAEAFVAGAAPSRNGERRMTRRRIAKLYRDLWGRRVWREWRQRVLREGSLIVGDALCALAASMLVSMLGGSRLDARLAVLAGVLGQGLLGTYRAGPFRRNRDRILAGIVVTCAVTALMPGAGSQPGPRLSTAVAFAAVLLVLVLAVRMSVERIVHFAHRNGIARRRTLIVGADEESWRVINHFRLKREESLHIVGHVCSEPANSPAAMGALSALPGLIEQFDIQHVLVAEELRSDVYEDLVRECLLRGATIGAISGLLDAEDHRTTFRDVAGWPALQLRVSRREMLEVMTKRTLDIAASACLLVLASPVLAVIALAVKLDSPGPALFSQPRPGLGGRQFRLLKFRSMRADAEAVLASDPELYQRYLDNDCKLPPGEDPRVSRLGRFLRGSSLDELPQLFNVLAGDMSLVGPRPVVGPEHASFGDLVSVILSVKPGMTGLWQVSGRSHVAGMSRAAMDVEYVSRWSLWLDLRILAKTIPIVFRRAGAF